MIDIISTLKTHSISYSISYNHLVLYNSITHVRGMFPLYNITYNEIDITYILTTLIDKSYALDEMSFEEWCEDYGKTTLNIQEYVDAVKNITLLKTVISEYVISSIFNEDIYQGYI